MKRSVVIITPGTFPIPASLASSVEHSVMNAIPYLTPHMDVTVYGKKFHDVPERLNMDGAQYVNVPPSPHQTYLSQIISRINQQSHTPDLIQIENRPHYVAIMKDHLPNRQIWLRLHSVKFLPHNRKGKERKLGMAGLRCVDRVVVNSHFLKDQVVQRYPQVASKVLVNHLGVNPDMFPSRYAAGLQHQRKADAKALGLRGKVILYAGRFQRIKGVHRLLLAFRAIRKSCPDAKLLLIGGHTYGQSIRTPYISYLQRLARPYLQSIRHIPFVPMAHMPRYYRLADVVVVPSIGPEAFGLVNLEAMASEVPVVASQIGGIPEAIVDGKTGFTVPMFQHTQHLAHSITYLLQHQDNCRRLGQEGRKRVLNNFTWETSAQRLQRLYQAHI
ncbi:glycosyltransferase family 4 protein [Caldalkalibacillus salinus]|uniref:glycosyltransferase family 4 protein n=1 Tax=Caldalkalibacillus salinus TaxID=2803787 RepID=UPI001920C65E|nr:glycosyltransferase family 4 protein [Caldalkalibacillus salinus]